MGSGIDLEKLNYGLIKGEILVLLIVRLNIGISPMNQNQKPSKLARRERKSNSEMNCFKKFYIFRLYASSLEELPHLFEGNFHYFFSFKAENRKILDTNPKSFPQSMTHLNFHGHNLDVL